MMVKTGVLWRNWGVVAVVTGKGPLYGTKRSYTLG